MTKLVTRDEAEALASIWDLMVEGNDDKAIIEKMGVPAETYKLLRQRLLAEKAAELKAKPPEHVYVEYVVWQTQGINDLSKMIAEFKTTKQYNALVGAVRVRAELYDKLIAKGQEFGVFRKTPERKEVVGGFVVADLTNEALRAMITKSLTDMDKLVKRYGDGDIIDIDPGPTHSGPRLVADAAGDMIETIEAPPGKDDAPVATPAMKRAAASLSPSIMSAPRPATARTSKHSTKARGRRPFAEATPTKVIHEPGSEVWDD